MSNPLDLDAYCERIGLRSVPRADERGLAEMQHAQRLAIPFENLDIALGRGVSLDPDAVFAKLVAARRGGYCFEQNQLLLRALEALGLAARPLLGRVWLTAQDVPGLTHTLNLVTLGGREWIADAGFGGGDMPVMPLEADRIQRTDDGAFHRLRRDPEHGWMIERDGGSGWQRQYSFTLARVYPADLEQGNHWTATAPQSRFTRWRIVGIVLPGGRASLMDRQFTRVEAGRSTEETVETAEAYRSVLADVFGIRLEAGEADRLFAPLQEVEAA